MLALVTIIVYLPALKNGFVNYDDPDYVTANPQVQAGLTGKGVVGAFTTGRADNWHPVTWLSHMLDCELFGVRPGPAHAVSVVFHAANAVLLFFWLNAVTGFAGRSWFVAGLFALHPLHVESVAWIAERKDVLSTFFFLLTLLAYCRYAAAATGKWRWYGTAIVMFGFGLMSKSMLVTTPFVLLLLDQWPLRRIRFESPNRLQAFGRLVLEKSPFLLLSAAASFVTLIVQQRGGAVTDAIPFGDRVANAFVSIARYLVKAAWPADLAVFYPHPGTWPAAAVLASVLLVAAVSIVAAAKLTRMPWVATGWFWFIGTLVPVLGFIQVGMQSMADRYTYIPLVGVFVGAVWLVAERASKRPVTRKLAATFSTFVLLAFALVSFRQLGFWKNSETLFTHAISTTTANFLAHNNLGAHYASVGQTDKEIAEYRMSLAIKPDFTEALNNLASALSTRGELEQALPLYEQAVAQASDRTEVRVNLANALHQLGRLEQAIEHYEVALQAEPQSAEILGQLGVACAKQGQLDRAVEHLRHAVQLRPGDADAHANLGNAFVLRQDWVQAAREYSHALELKPGDPEMQRRLAQVRLRMEPR